MYNRVQLKQEAKQIMGAARPRPMWVALLYLVITSVGSSLLQGIFNLISGTSFLSELLSAIPEKMMMGRDPAEIIEEMILLYSDRLLALVATVAVSSLVLSVLLTLWQSLMNVGFSGYCLSLAGGEKSDVGHIFCGFPLIGKVILTGLFVWIFTSLWMLLFGVCLAVLVLVGVLLLNSIPAISVILFIGGCIGFIVMAIRVSLRYAMVNYILLDTGKYGLDAITESKNMMKGNKGKLFMLHLSFIGWYLLIFAITWVGCIIIGVIIAIGSVAGMVSASMGAVAGMVGGVIFVFILMLAGVWLLDIWLKPYVTGSVAKFYLFFKAQQSPANVGWPVLGESADPCGTPDDQQK